MKEEQGKPTRSSTEGTPPPYRVNFAGRPFITFDKFAKITDCSREIIDLLHISKNEILASDPASDPLNKAFSAALECTLSDGINYFSGRLIISDKALPSDYSFVMIPLETVMREAVGIICFLLPANAARHEHAPAAVAETAPPPESTSAILPPQADLFNQPVSREPKHTNADEDNKFEFVKYRQLLMSLPTGVALLDLKGRIFEINQVMAGIMGKEVEHFDKSYDIHESHFMRHAGVAIAFDSCLSKKSSQHGELLFQNAESGTNTFLQFSFVPIFDQKNEIELVVLNVRDASQLKNLESQSNDRVEFLNVVINSLSLPFFVKDEQHRWVMLNEAALKMMGHTRDELIGKSDYDIFPKEQADEFWAKDELVFKDGFNVNEEIITWSDGSIHTIITSKQLHVEKPGNRKFIVGTNMDITEMKLKEAELIASEAKYRNLFDNANDFIITIDLTGNITNANARFLKEMGVSLDELCHHNIKDFIRPEDMDKYWQLADNILHGSQNSAIEFEAYNLRKELRNFDVRASLMQTDNEPVGIQLIFEDSTEKKLAHIQLQEYSTELQNLNATKDKFFSIIAHDLRNPYSSLIGFTELMLEDLDKLTLDEMREYLRIIRNSAKNSLNLLENLLAWSRLQTNRMTFDPQKINLYNVVEEVVEVLNSLAYRKKIDISILVEPQIELYADKNMLITILHNLVMNAVKFTPTGGNIYISDNLPEMKEGETQPFLYISVSDTGVGIDEKLQAKLFSGDKPESKPGTDKEQGSGLGLLLSQEMVERHGGKIWVKSNPGEGSVFTFMMPLFEGNRKSE